MIGTDFFNVFKVFADSFFVKIDPEMKPAS